MGKGKQFLKQLWVKPGPTLGGGSRGDRPCAYWIPVAAAPKGISESLQVLLHNGYTSQGPEQSLSAVQKFLHSLSSGQASQHHCCLSLVSSEYQRFPGTFPEAFSSAWVIAKLKSFFESLVAIILKIAEEKLAGSTTVPKRLNLYRSHCLASKNIYLNQDTFISTLHTFKVLPVKSQNLLVAGNKNFSFGDFLKSFLFYIIIIPHIPKCGSAPLSCSN